MDTLDGADSENLPKRGPAALDRQLSGLQFRLLTWLLLQERTLRPEDKKEFNRFGVVWKAKRFFVACGGQAPTASERAAVSRSLHRLAERGLVVLSMQGKRTGHIKLTPRGRTLAESWSVDGLSERQTFDLEKRAAKYVSLVALREEKQQKRAELSTLSIDQIHALFDSCRLRRSMYTFCDIRPNEEQCTEYVDIVKKITYLVDLLGNEYLDDEIPTVCYLNKLLEESKRALKAFKEAVDKLEAEDADTC